MRSLLAEPHRHVAGGRVLLNVSQGLLKNSIKRQFSLLGKSHGQLHAGQLYHDARPTRKLRADLAKGCAQTQMVQYMGS